jgi:hypothetical protein
MIDADEGNRILAGFARPRWKVAMLVLAEHVAGR